MVTGVLRRLSKLLGWCEESAFDAERKPENDPPEHVVVMCGDVGNHAVDDDGISFVAGRVLNPSFEGSTRNTHRVDCCKYAKNGHGNFEGDVDEADVTSKDVGINVGKSRSSFRCTMTKEVS